MRQTEFLIIGQGICGTFLSWYLQKEQRSFIVIDNADPLSSSRVAAGVINPVTGRRIVQTWMIDELLPFALQQYQAIGKELGTEIITEKNIVDFFPSPQMLNAFTDRIQEDPKYLSFPDHPRQYDSIFQYDFGFGEITPCYTVQLSALLKGWKNVLRKNNQLLEEECQSADIVISEKDIRHKDIIADKIIFCDGIHSAENPWFKNLPFAINKGEALIIRTKDIPAENIYKKALSLVPLQDDLFWAGSSYEWNYSDASPSTAFRDKTIAQLKHWLKLSFVVEEHLASLRPATLERRPFVGIHPHHTRIGILNGMGTKGCSLAPYFAWQLANHLTKHTPILPEAAISRFTRLLK